jgi:nitrogen fixation NifU-like protein
MQSEWDRFAEELQDAVLEGYTDQLKHEFLHPRNIGRIENPSGSAKITGVCGDTVEMYLSISGRRISDIKFMTDGCGFTTACASYVTRMSKGRTIEEVLRITPEDVDSHFGGLPAGNKHCSELAVGTLVGAIGNYLAGSGDGNQELKRGCGEPGEP